MFTWLNHSVRYLIKYYSGCFWDSVFEWDEQLNQRTLSKAACPPKCGRASSSPVEVLNRIDWLPSGEKDSCQLIAFGFKQQLFPGSPARHPTLQTLHLPDLHISSGNFLFKKKKKKDSISWWFYFPEDPWLKQALSLILFLILWNIYALSIRYSYLFKYRNVLRQQIINKCLLSKWVRSWPICLF